MFVHIAALLEGCVIFPKKKKKITYTFSHLETLCE